MYGIGSSFNKLDVNILSNLSFLNGFDSRISVIESRSLQDYFYNNLVAEFDHYVEKKLYHISVQKRYDDILNMYSIIIAKKKS